MSSSHKERFQGRFLLSADARSGQVNDVVRATQHGCDIANEVEVHRMLQVQERSVADEGRSGTSARDIQFLASRLQRPGGAAEGELDAAFVFRSR